MDYRIFKYKIINGTAIIPHGAVVLRCDHVDDGFYKGDFVWAIVDTQEKRNQSFIPSLSHIPQIAICKTGQVTESLPIDGLSPHRLKIQERQAIHGGKPVLAGEKNGDIFVYCSGDDRGDHEIAVFKTGQAIDIDIDRLVYLGLNRIWIVQELGLYTFLVQK